MGCDPNLGREAIGMGRQGFVEKKRIFCYFSVNSNFLEAVVVPVVLPHYRFFFYFSLPYFSIRLLFGIK